MKGMVLTKYGPPEVIKLQEVDKPTPKDNQVLIRIHATTVTAGDCEVRGMTFPLWLSIPMRLYMGITKPRRTIMLGQEISGEVEAIGKDVTNLKPGDAVFAMTGFNFGGSAEYICLEADPKEGAIATMPNNMAYEEAAAVPLGGLEALHFISKANLQKGQSILINGAGGSIGTMAIQLAKQLGAEVTAVDHTDKLDMMHDIGADHVIDYTKEDFAKMGRTYDVIFDVICKNSFARSIKSLKNDGRYLMGNPRLSTMLRSLWVTRGSNKKIIFETNVHKSKNLIYLRDMIEAGQLKTVIDRVYPLEETADAHRYVETGQKKGNVIVAVTPAE